MLIGDIPSKKYSLDDLLICHKCGKKLKNVKDPKTNKIDKYSWECKCNKKLMVRRY